MLRISGNQQKLEKARKDSSLEPSEGARPCQNLDFGLPASGTVRECYFKAHCWWWFVTAALGN